MRSLAVLGKRRGPPWRAEKCVRTCIIKGRRVNEDCDRWRVGFVSCLRTRSVSEALAGTSGSEQNRARFFRDGYGLPAQPGRGFPG